MSADPALEPATLSVAAWVKAAPLAGIRLIADSSHGFKMTGVGKLVAKQLVGEDPAELKPFAFARFASGATFGDSNSHSPWV